MIRNKTFYFLITFIFFLAACSSPDKTPKESEPDAPTANTIRDDVKKYPDSLQLVHDLIEAYRNEGQYDSALSVTDRQILKDSGNAYLWNIKATLYFEIKDTVLAVKSLMKAIDIYPLPEYLVALGTIFATTKNPNALLISNELLAFNRNKSADDAYFIKGLYYNFTNAPKKAIVFLDSCLNLNYTYMYAYREKGIALYNLGKYDDAVLVLQRAVTLQNNYDEGYFWLGKCYEKLNQKENAIQSYQNALLFDKDFTEARQALERLQK
ncbi:MAG: tetratricopeptide repeat protein [Ginsengibacter sp.]